MHIIFLTTTSGQDPLTVMTGPQSSILKVYPVPFGPLGDNVTTGFEEVVVGPNEVIHKASCDGTSSSVSGNEVLNSCLFCDGSETMLIIKRNLS